MGQFMKLFYVSMLLFFTVSFSCSRGLQPDLVKAVEPTEPEQASAGESERSEDEEGSGGADGPSSEDGLSDVLDPFAPYPDSTEGLINTSSNLRELLEFGALDDACDAWRASPENRRLKLMCGKWMFFYEGFGTMGIPTPLMDWVGRNFPDADEPGPAFTNYGLIQDPYHSTDEQPRHLGVGDGAPMGGTETLAFTCANCHFGQMPDGRYSVGYPNLQYEYGAHMLSLFIVPMRGMPGFDATTVHPDALAVTRPLLERFDEDPFLSLGMALHMLPMMASGLSDIPTVTKGNQGHYASWKAGTMDFTMAPLPIEDEIHTVSRILPLWNIPTQERQALYGMDNALLAWTGSAHTLDEFLSGFVIIGGGPLEEWGPENLSPLREYIESLRAPEPLSDQDSERVEAGRTQFREAGCEDCHAGPSGSGLNVFAFEEIGTDSEMSWWGDGDRDGEMCCDVEGMLTGGIKAPRLRGVHALTRFLHNGSLGSLEELLCLSARPTSELPPFANYGHEYGCDLPQTSRLDLLAFLQSI